MVEGAANVDNIYALLAVLCAVLATAAFRFFKGEKLRVRLIVFVVLLALAVYSGFMARPYDPDALRKERIARIVIQQRDSARIAAAEASIDLHKATLELLTLKIDSIVSGGRRILTQRLDKQRQIEKAAEIKRLNAESAGRIAEQNEWKSARANIKWVFDDNGARRKYDQKRQSGLSKYASVLAAQAHNPAVQNVISRYGEVRTEQYIAELGY